MTRICMVLTNLNYSDGVTTFCMNYYDHLDHEAFQMDFIIHTKPQDHLREKIEANGDHIFVMPYLSGKNILKINKMVSKLFEENHYDIVHCNLPNAAFIYLRQAKKHHIKTRIIHSHFTQFSDIPSLAKRNKILYDFSKKYINHNFACSKVAGDFLFGKESYDIIYNSIDYNRFLYNETNRKAIREEYQMKEDDVLLGLVGRCSQQKNILFAIKLLKKLPRNYHLMVIGSHNNPEYYEECRKEKGEDTRILFLDPKQNIEAYYSAFDLLLLPSLYEGLPLTLVEAQASGLNCLSSSLVTTEIQLGGVSYLPLEEDVWLKAMEDRQTRENRQAYYDDKFDIYHSAKNLMDLYESLKK